MAKTKHDYQHRHYQLLVRNALITKNTADDRHFQLRNGKYHKSYFTLEVLDPIEFAYLNSDSIEYAIVPMVLNGGGTGDFYSINIFAKQNDTAHQITFTEIGDRIQIDSIRINRNNISVFIIEREGTSNALHFLFRNDSLVTVN